MSQKVTLSKRDLIHIQHIKQLIFDNKSQVEMSVALGLRRETVNRKLRKWMRTPDFVAWLKEAWLNKLTKVDDVEAFRGLTKLWVAYLRMDQPEDYDVPITIKWPSWMKRVTNKQGTNHSV